MASNGQSGKWEVVGKGGKKRAPNEGKKNKVKASDMPKAEIISKFTNCKLFWGNTRKTNLVCVVTPRMQPVFGLRSKFVMSVKSAH